MTGAQGSIRSWTVIALTLLVAALIVGNVEVESLLTQGESEVFPGTKTIPSALPSPSPTPTPTIKPATQGGVKSKQAIATPTPNPDPIITCKSKTGDIQVRRSVCQSYTDCPDGYGGYIFESQESCKARWGKVADELNQAVKDYANAVRERNQLFYDYLQYQMDSYKPPSFDLGPLPEGDFTTEPLPTISPKTPEPTPNYEGTQVWP